VLRQGVGVTDSNPPWYQDGLCFSCTQCGNCCSGAPGYVWVTNAEIEAIAQFLGLLPAEFVRLHVRKTNHSRSLLEKPGGDCEFLERLPDGRTQCQIHSVRPVQCRTWPFWKSNLATPEDWADTGRDCPGINRGGRHPLPVIQAALTENGRRPL
jgi:uncharacterized protein